MVATIEVQVDSAIHLKTLPGDRLILRRCIVLYSQIRVRVRARAGCEWNGTCFRDDVKYVIVNNRVAATGCFEVVMPSQSTRMYISLGRAV